MNNDKTCSHCEGTTEKIMVTGKRQIEHDVIDALLPYALCRKCNNILRASSHKTYNNAPNTNMDNTRKKFWQKIEGVLIQTEIEKSARK